MKAVIRGTFVPSAPDSSPVPLPLSTPAGEVQFAYTGDKDLHANPAVEVSISPFFEPYAIRTF